MSNALHCSIQHQKLLRLPPGVAVKRQHTRSRGLSTRAGTVGEALSGGVSNQGPGPETTEPQGGMFDTMSEPLSATKQSILPLSSPSSHMDNFKGYFLPSGKLLLLIMLFWVYLIRYAMLIHLGVYGVCFTDYKTARGGINMRQN